MTRKIPFGRQMRQKHFQFAPSYTPINHGSFGAYPRLIQDQQDAFTKLTAQRPDTFIVSDLPVLIDESREAIAPLLGAAVDEVVFVPNATTGVNTVLRNLKWEDGDVVLHFSTIYGACEKTLSSISEMTPLKTVSITLEYPIEDEEILERLSGTIERLRGEGLNVKLAIFDTILTFPGARMPWEKMVDVCKEAGVLSLIDGAHGIGHIDLTHLAKVSPDFFVSNCHKWLYTPRGCAVFYVPFRNQHLIRTSIPTSHGYQYPSEPSETDGKPPFVYLFQFVATIDYTPYLCVPAAIAFRRTICGGEEAIRKYCWELAATGGLRVAEILGTTVMNTNLGTMRNCCFANVKLPLAPYSDSLNKTDIEKLMKWLNATAVRDYDTYLQIAFHADSVWVRLSGQLYLDMNDFVWVGTKLQELCRRARSGEAGL